MNLLVTVLNTLCMSELVVTDIGYHLQWLAVIVDLTCTVFARIGTAPRIVITVRLGTALSKLHYR